MALILYYYHTLTIQLLIPYCLRCLLSLYLVSGFVQANKLIPITAAIPTTAAFLTHLFTIFLSTLILLASSTIFSLSCSSIIGTFTTLPLLTGFYFTYDINSFSVIPNLFATSVIETNLSFTISTKRFNLPSSLPVLIPSFYIIKSNPAIFLSPPTC